MALLLVLLFVVVPIAELYVIIQIGQAIGILPTIALLILASVLGATLMRSQGRATWRRFNSALAAGRIPGREVMDGALVIFGGALLLTPGFLSDILGLILLLPPTRALVRALLVRRFAGPIAAGAASGAQARMGRMFTFGTRPRPRAGRDDGFGRHGAASDPDDDVVDGSASDIPPQRRELP
ncbi:MAG: FxsA family protein [Actinobacteria bacterium]|nr:FxsA family protein [Actinomycetota bacterium]